MSDETPPITIPGGKPPVELAVARINGRFIAYVFDTILFALGYCATLIAAAKMSGGVSRDFVVRAGQTWLVLYVLYQFLGNLLGSTLGKKLMGLQVLRADGEPLGVARSLIRAVVYVLGTPFFNFGFLVALLTPSSRALHDLAAGSVVVEAESQNPAEAAAVFLGAVSLFVLLAGSMLWLSSLRPTAGDLDARRKGREALLVLAQIEDNYRAAHGVYTPSLSDLAVTSGDLNRFKYALLAIFDPNSFRIEAGNNGYRISAAARDRQRTRLTVTGPPPSVTP